ncbi:MAG: 50S ribosomal protein L14 [archaeon]
MKAIKSSITRGLQVGSTLQVCDNSGAKVIQIISVKGYKGVKRRRSPAGVGDIVTVSVIKGKSDVRKQVMQAVIVRQKKEYKRPDGTRIKFEDNAAILLKDDKGNVKGTMFKGPIAKEATERWPTISKVASIVV